MTTAVLGGVALALGWLAGEYLAALGRVNGENAALRERVAGLEREAERLHGLLDQARRVNLNYLRGVGDPCRDTTRD